MPFYLLSVSFAVSCPHQFMFSEELFIARNYVVYLYFFSHVYFVNTYGLLVPKFNSVPSFIVWYCAHLYHYFHCHPLLSHYSYSVHYSRPLRPYFSFRILPQVWRPITVPQSEFLYFFFCISLLFGEGQEKETVRRKERAERARRCFSQWTRRGAETSVLYSLDTTVMWSSYPVGVAELLPLITPLDHCDRLCIVVGGASLEL